MKFYNLEAWCVLGRLRSVSKCAQNLRCVLTGVVKLSRQQKLRSDWRDTKLICCTDSVVSPVTMVLFVSYLQGLNVLNYAGHLGIYVTATVYFQICNGHP